MSAIHLERNGWNLGGQRARHMDVHYFCVTNTVAAGEIILEHCPASEMRGDLFLKPLQGSLFCKFRALTLNLMENDHQFSKSEVTGLETGWDPDLV
eukprot:1289630-Ditylum_brightwellii.AAC.1